MNSNATVPLAIIMGGIIIAGAVYLSAAKRLPGEPGGGNPSLVRPVESSDHVLGNPAAPVKIVEYSDFYCSFCKQFHSTLSQVLANEGAGGEVAWVYRHFPLSEIHPNAFAAARASECAATVGGNEAFWMFAEELFAAQPADPKKFGEYAKTAGVPGETFAACYANNAAVDERVTADRQNAMALGARGTPLSLILVAGKPPVVVDGAYSYDALKMLVDQALQGASSPTSASR